MMKTEFEDLIHGSVTDEEYELYKSFGLIIFKDMFRRAMKLKEIDEEIRSLNRAKDSLVAERERLKKGA